MKRISLVLAAAIGLILVSDPTYAQTPTPAAAPAPAAPATPAPAAGSANTDAAPSGAPEKVKQIRQACREQIKGQDLKGENRMKAVSACIVKERPDLAQREQCRMDGWDKGLRKDELKGFVKDCVKGKA